MIQKQLEPKRTLRIWQGVGIILVGTWLAIGLRTGIWTFYDYGRYIYLVENISVARELWRGEINAGDTVEQLVVNGHPDQIQHFGPWIQFTWFPGGFQKNYLSFIGISVLAKDGVLVRADFWPDDGLATRCFFNTLTLETQAQFYAAQKKYADAVIARWKIAARSGGSTH